MPEIEELKRRLASLKKAAPWAKVEAAEELIENISRILIAMDARLEKLEGVEHGKG